MRNGTFCNIKRHVFVTHWLSATCADSPKQPENKPAAPFGMRWERRAYIIFMQPKRHFHAAARRHTRSLRQRGRKGKRLFTRESLPDSSLFMAKQ